MSSERSVALVTGGSRGIGLGIALRLARDGMNIVINGRRSVEEVKDSVSQLEQVGAEVMYCRADVSSGADRSQMLEDIKAYFGRLDVLVNNAGIAPSVRADVLEATEESFDQLINVNVKGPYFLTQQVAKWMIEQGGGNQDRQSASGGRYTIVNIGSVSATVVSVNRGDYCISKAGVAMATQLWAARLAEYGIDVFEVRPGIIATDMTSKVKEKYDRLMNETELLVTKRWGEAEDVAKAVGALVRGDVPYATGQVIVQDGGLTLQRL